MLSINVCIDTNIRRYHYEKKNILLRACGNAIRKVKVYRKREKEKGGGEKGRLNFTLMRKISQSAHGLAASCVAAEIKILSSLYFQCAR